MEQCETCLYGEYDEQMGEYVCLMLWDEDDVAQLAAGHDTTCPYFRFGDDYTLARRQ